MSEESKSKHKEYLDSIAEHINNKTEERSKTLEGVANIMEKNVKPYGRDKISIMMDRYQTVLKDLHNSTYAVQIDSLNAASTILAMRNTQNAIIHELNAALTTIHMLTTLLLEKNVFTEEELIEKTEAFLAEQQQEQGCCGSCNPEEPCHESCECVDGKCCGANESQPQENLSESQPAEPSEQ